MKALIMVEEFYFLVVRGFFMTVVLSFKVGTFEKYIKQYFPTRRCV